MQPHEVLKAVMEERNNVIKSVNNGMVFTCGGVEFTEEEFKNLIKDYDRLIVDIAKATKFSLDYDTIYAPFSENNGEIIGLSEITDLIISPFDLCYLTITKKDEKGKSNFLVSYLVRNVFVDGKKSFSYNRFVQEKDGRCNFFTPVIQMAFCVNERMNFLTRGDRHARNYFRTIMDNAKQKEIVDKCISMICYCYALLSCSNISYKNVPAPEKLNKKRIKNKKLPIFEYKILVLNTGDKSVNINSEELSKEGIKQRLHIRRRHIRRVGKEKIKKTIEAYWAGDINLGMVVKDYKVK